ncbi:alpha/beta hydrolase [Haloarcula sp. CBA1130]|uniref:alpha/beta hydrolase n=1 Tax=unclassified Haloarcula TaxID=2624677 RepID=UPI0012492DAC|nr:MULTISPECIES: alpha/beta hydrolase [unclassified Haloarcula]KAA9398663.1 alpha/beta hydrolase [Haloarcula sp. CBA1129]KAA9403180.1 alpha/beta hydrolase [Haloarcula sp. CBA1130]
MTDRAPESVTVQRDIPFHEVDGETLTLDLYDSPATSGPKPVAVLVRGGAFTFGDKGEFARHALDLAADGFLVIEPQYRLAPEWTFPAALVDVKAAIEWARAEGESRGADTNRIVGVGHSAGANLVLLAALTADEPGFEPELYPGASSALSAAVGYAGIYDFHAFDTASGVPAGEGHRAYLGGGPDDEPAAYDLASPVAQVDIDAPPTLLLHGTEDNVVPPAQSELLADALGPMTDVIHETVPADHGFPFHGAHYDDVYERTVEFIGQAGVGGPDIADETGPVNDTGLPGGDLPGPSGDIDGPRPTDRGGPNSRNRRDDPEF